MLPTVQAANIELPVVAWFYGKFNSEVVSLLPKTGYLGAAAYDGNINIISNMNLYEIGRVKIFAEIPPQAYAQVPGLKIV